MATPKAVTPVKTIDQIKQELSDIRIACDPKHVLRKADEAIGEKKGEQSTGPESPIFKAMTLYEFDNGALLTTTVSEQYKTLAIEMSRNLQKEFNCQTSAEKALVEIVTMNYIRTLDIQRRINNYLEKDTINEVGVKFLDLMSKELDRANRHYIQAVEALKVFKQPAMQLKISANTAVVGQNQVVQAVKQDVTT